MRLRWTVAVIACAALAWTTMSAEMPWLIEGAFAPAQVGCPVEIPWFLEFQKQYGSKGFQVIGVSTDDTLAKLTPYVASMKMTYPVLQGLGNDKIVDEFGATIALPTTILISRDGKICGRHIGLTGKEIFEAEIKALL